MTKSDEPLMVPQATGTDTENLADLAGDILYLTQQIEWKYADIRKMERTRVALMKLWDELYGIEKEHIESAHMSGRTDL